MTAAPDAPSCEEHAEGCPPECLAYATELEAALHYVARGWRVLPVKPGTKAAALPKWPERATTDPDTVAAWWGEGGRYVGHGVAIATGPASGVFVVDVDVKGEHAGDATLAAREAEHGALPTTPKVVTPSDGWHLYFAYPEGLEIRNDAGRRLGDGVDVRGAGGYVVAPPTAIGISAYDWAENVAGDLADAPAWLLEMLTAKPERQVRAGEELPVPIPIRPPKGDPRPPLEDDEPVPLAARSASPLEAERPGDRFEARTTWAQLLEADGWQRGPDVGGQEQWVRPGKDPREGISATVGGPGDPEGRWLYVHTTSLDWLPEGAHSRFDYYARRHHAGDHGAAARALADLERGGTSSTPRQAAPSRPEVVNRSASGDWLEPMPLAGGDTVPEFPVDALPKPVAEFVAACAESLGTKPDLVAALALGTIATVTAGRWKVNPWGDWHEAVTVYTVAVAAPGSMKSAALGHAIAPLRELKSEIAERLGPNVAVKRAEREADEKRKAAAQAAYAKDASAENRGALEDIVRYLATTPPPVMPDLYTTDATPEALEDAIAAQGGRYGWLSAEGGIFGMIAGRYSEGSNIDVFLKAFDGDELAGKRIGREAAMVSSATLAVGVAVQPDVLKNAAKRPELRGTGLLDRFLITWPALTPSRPSPRSPRIPEHVLAGYRDALRALWDASGGANPEQVVRSLRFDTDATEGMDAFVGEVHDMRQAGGPLEHMGEYAEKLRGKAARLAALFALLEDPRTDTVRAPAMAQARTVALYFAAHARHAYGAIGARDDLAAATRCLEAIRTAKRTESKWREHPHVVTTRDVLTRMGTTEGLATSPEVEKALRLLEDYGWLQELTVPEGERTRGRPSQRWAVNPATYATAQE